MSDSVSASTSNISDLSYRGYDGPLLTRRHRWWIISIAGIRPLAKKPWFWILALFCAIPYAGDGFELFMLSQRQGMPRVFPYSHYFFEALGPQSFFLFLTALSIGASSIAADNAANALQIYLSRPITRTDYLLGKWLGVLLPLYALSTVPALVLYAYCLLSFNHAAPPSPANELLLARGMEALTQSFWREDPWMLGRVLLVTLIGPLIQSSIVVACSACTRASRVAGGLFAFIYLLGPILAQIVDGILIHRSPAVRGIAHYAHVEGIIEALSSRVYRISERGFRPRGFVPIALPGTAYLTVAAAVLIVGSLLVARERIRAVQVVRG